MTPQEVQAQINAYTARIDAYQRQVQAYAAELASQQYGNYLPDLPPEKPKMKPVIVVHQVSNGFTAVVNDDPDRNTVVGEQLMDVVTAATNLYAQRKLEAESRGVSSPNAGDAQSLLQDAAKQMQDNMDAIRYSILTGSSGLAVPPVTPKNHQSLMERLKKGW